MTLRLRFTSLLLAAGPLALLLVFVVLRDAPPSWGCGEGETDPALIDRYTAGLPWVAAFAAATALAVLVEALRQTEDPAAWRVRVATAVVAVAAGLAAGVGANRLVGHAATFVVAGLLVAVGTRALLARLSGRRVTPVAVAAFAPIAAALALPVAAVVVAASVLTLPVWPALLVAGAVLLWPWVDQARPADVAGIAALHGAVLLPAAILAVDWQGHGPLMC